MPRWGVDGLNVHDGGQTAAIGAFDRDILVFQGLTAPQDHRREVGNALRGITPQTKRRVVAAQQTAVRGPDTYRRWNSVEHGLVQIVKPIQSGRRAYQCLHVHSRPSHPDPIYVRHDQVFREWLFLFQLCCRRCAPWADEMELETARRILWGMVPLEQAKDILAHPEVAAAVAGLRYISDEDT